MLPRWSNVLDRVTTAVTARHDVIERDVHRIARVSDVPVERQIRDRVKKRLAERASQRSMEDEWDSLA